MCKESFTRFKGKLHEKNLKSFVIGYQRINTKDISNSSSSSILSDIGMVSLTHKHYHTEYEQIDQ